MDSHQQHLCGNLYIFKLNLILRKQSKKYKLLDCKTTGLDTWKHQHHGNKKKNHNCSRMKRWKRHSKLLQTTANNRVILDYLKLEEKEQTGKGASLKGFPLTKLGIGNNWFRSGNFWILKPLGLKFLRKKIFTWSQRSARTLPIN